MGILPPGSAPSTPGGAATLGINVPQHDPPEWLIRGQGSGKAAFQQAGSSVAGWSGSQAWCRRAWAMLVVLVRRRALMARLRGDAHDAGAVAGPDVGTVFVENERRGPSAGGYRVGPPHCCSGPPAGSCVPLVAAHGSGGPHGRAGIVRYWSVSCVCVPWWRWMQWTCTRRWFVRLLRRSVIALCAIALRIPRYQVSHWIGVSGVQQ